MRLLLPLSILILAAAANGDTGRESSSPAAAEVSGSAPRPASFEAPTLPPVLPALTVSPDISRSGVAEHGADETWSVDREPLLVDAQVLEKYRAFRESLTSP